MVQTQERKCFTRKEDVRKEKDVWIYGSICKLSMLFLFLSPPAWSPPSSKQRISSQLEDPFILKSIKRRLYLTSPMFVFLSNFSCFPYFTFWYCFSTWSGICCQIYLCLINDPLMSDVLSLGHTITCFFASCGLINYLDVR
ncbi:hypothetical protein OIU77_025658 [Salix suchowensis]|uniref:Transmembrane protein n=1 Tax=Salix suchowensis TaxID=1278906 RepID=A0ABQ9BWZ9_9ROSI|nr:hypothetical protein OIU77_025658 [Salix suchowensis]